MKKALIIPASGIGDALLMMIASHRLVQEGYAVKTIHPLLGQLSEWFPGHIFDSKWEERDIQEADWILIQNDNSARIALFKQHVMREKISFFYPTYNFKKQGPLRSHDQVFDPNKPMADNIAVAIAKLVSSAHVSKSNGLIVPNKLIHRKYLNRVAIHPMSADPRKNWNREKYVDLAQKLKEKGFDPYFILSPKERLIWGNFEINSPLFPTLSDIASFLFESGYAIGNDSVVGHLSSNLHIPTLIIADNNVRMRLWRPGWLTGSVITPPVWIPNWKFLRLRKKHWRTWISVKMVLRAFNEISRPS